MWHDRITFMSHSTPHNTQVKNDRSASDVWILTDLEGFACHFWPNRLDFASILTDPEEFAWHFWPNRLDLPPFWRNKGSCLPILTEQARFASILTLHGKCWASSLVWVIYWSTCNRRVLWRLYLTAVYQSWVVLWTSSKFKRVKSALNSNDEVQI